YTGPAGARYRCTRAYVGLVAGDSAFKPRQIAWTRVVFPAPSSPENPRTAGAWSVRPSSSPNRLSSSAVRRTAPGIALRLQVEDLVAEQSRGFEVELFGGRLHLGFEQSDERLALAGVRRLLRRARFGAAHASIRYAGDEPDIQYGLHDRGRRDTMLHVVGLLDRAAAAHLVQRPLHRPRHPVRIQDRPPMEVSGRPSHRLNEGPVGTQESLLVGIQHGYQRHFRQVEAFAQKVDPHEHVELAEPQPADDLDALDGVDFGVQIPDAHRLLLQVVREVFRHPFGEGRDEHP